MITNSFLHLQILPFSPPFLEGREFSREKKQQKIRYYFDQLREMEVKLKQQDHLFLEQFLLLQKNVVEAKSAVEALPWIPYHLEEDVQQCHAWFEKLQTEIYRKCIPYLETEEIVAESIEERINALVESIDLSVCEPEEEWPEWEEVPVLWEEYQQTLIKIISLTERGRGMNIKKYEALRYQSIHLFFLLERFRFFSGHELMKYLLNSFAGNRTGDCIRIEKFSDPRFLAVFKVAVALLEINSNHVLEEGTVILRCVIRYLSPTQPSTLSFLRFFFDKVSETKFQRKVHKRERSLKKLKGMALADLPNDFSLLSRDFFGRLPKKLGIHANITRNKRIRRFCSVEHYQKESDTTWIWKLDSILADFRKQIFLNFIKKQIEVKRQEKSEAICPYMVHLLQLHHKRYSILIKSQEEKENPHFFYSEKIQLHFFSFTQAAFKEKMIAYVMQFFDPAWIASLDNRRLYIKKRKISRLGASALLFQAGYLVG